MKSIVSFFFFALLAIGAKAQDQTGRRIKQFNLNNGVAAGGYDPVSYFNDGGPLKGSKENAVVYEGITYYFSSPVNKAAFKKDPSRYEPLYGGWCAYAMGSKGEKVEVDPATYKITDGKLNLFYNKFFNNTLTKWNKDEPNLKKKADANWGRILDKN